MKLKSFPAAFFFSFLLLPQGQSGPMRYGVCQTLAPRMLCGGICASFRLRQIRPGLVWCLFGWRVSGNGATLLYKHWSQFFHSVVKVQFLFLFL